MNTENHSIIYNLNDYFKMPIHYNDEKIEINKNIISDLELINTVDPSCSPIYHFCFNNENDVSKKTAEEISRYYTTDIRFLQETQKLIKEYTPSTNSGFINYNKIIDIWNEVKISHGFNEKYCYVELEMLDFLNTSETFLQFISIYNLFSPIFSLFVPILILIIPFLILRMKNLPITVNEYIEVLKVVAQTNAIGKLFTVNFQEITAQEKIYIFVSAAFYLFSIYQNIMVCVRFHNNMKLIHEKFLEIHAYLANTMNRMNNYITYSNQLITHEQFNNILMDKIEILREINNKISSISEYRLYNIAKMKEIGRILKYFYELHTNKSYNDAIMYSIGFNGYLDCIEGLQTNLTQNKMNYAEFITDTKKTVFKNSYYACLSKTATKNGKLTLIKNTIKMNKNLIITGPNASGKTTVLKSTLFNIILTQQFGCGFYDSAKLAPFKHIHCYLNIPDTSGRDSLFQAEARRCKDILDIINSAKRESHFCAFDELYSGTNPEEAETSATAFMLYLNKYPNVTTLLTTHFIKVCKKLDKVDGFKNHKMVTNKIGDRIKYTYKLEKGISKIKGGINVLTDLNYPKEIIDNTVSYSTKKI